MRQRRFFVVLGAVALTAAVVPSASASADRGGDGPAARVWVTSADRAELLHDRGTVAFGTRPTGELTITVDPSRRYQTDGRLRRLDHRLLGRACSTGSTRRPASRRCASLFDPVRASGSASCASRSASSDFTDEPHYTYDDVPRRADRLRAGALQRSPTTRRRSCRCCAGPSALNPTAEGDRHAVEPAGVDEDHRLADRRTADGRPPHLRRVRALPGQVRPGLPGRRRPGRLPHGAERAAEPQAERATRAWTCRCAQEVQLIEALGPALQAAGLRTRRSSATTTTGPTHPDDIATTPPGRGPRDRLPVRAARAARPRRWVAGTAYHCYFGDPSAQTALHDAFPTRGSGSPSAPARTARPTRRRSSSATR